MTPDHSHQPLNQAETAPFRSIPALRQSLEPDRNLRQILQTITKNACSDLGAEDASVLLWDRERSELRSWATADGSTIRFDARLGVAGAAILDGKTHNVPDAQEHNDFYTQIDINTKKTTRNLLAIPLLSHDSHVLGVLELMNKRRGDFTRGDEDRGRALAEQAAQSIETFTTVRELREKHDELLLENRKLAEQAGGRLATQTLIGLSPPIQHIVRLIDQIRDTSSNVLITGENGTGKELVAQAIHRTSTRADQPFVSINCAAIPDTLIESELFGIEERVATDVRRRTGRFVQANGGTLFLDEVGDLSMNAQAKILRALQERRVQPVGSRDELPIDIRVVAATNKDLPALNAQGGFREDLFYRLKVFQFHTPALRDIPDDIPLLATHFLARFCRIMNKEEKHLTPQALRALQAYSWPGNVRQLENAMERVVGLTRRRAIAEHDLEPEIRANGSAPASTHRVPTTLTLPKAVEQLERDMIRQALDACDNNQVHTAKRLGISRQGLIKKMKRYGFSPRS